MVKVYLTLLCRAQPERTLWSHHTLGPSRSLGSVLLYCITFMWFWNPPPVEGLNSLLFWSCSEWEAPGWTLFVETLLRWEGFLWNCKLLRGRLWLIRLHTHLTAAQSTRLTWSISHMSKITWINRPAAVSLGHLSEERSITVNWLPPGAQLNQMTGEAAGQTW